MSRHPCFARCYAALSSRLLDAGARGHREELLAGLRGRVIEVGAGNGLNFAFYPSSVSEVVAVEPEPYLRSLAEQAARDAPCDVTVVDGLAEGLPCGDASFDAGVASLVLCSVPDQRTALRELHRVLREDAELRFYEHLQAETAGLRAFQRVVDVVHPLLAGGCHTGRQTVAAIESAGFEFERVRRFRFPGRLPAPESPHALGVARRHPDAPPP